MRTLTKIGLVFVIAGFSLQIYVICVSDASGGAQGAAAVLFLIGVFIEIIGYAVSDEQSKSESD